MPFDWHFTKSPQNFSPPRGNKKYASEEWSTERPFSEAKRASHCRCPRSWTLESLASFQTPQRKHKQTNVVFSRDCHKNGLGFKLVSPISPLLSSYSTWQVLPRNNSQDGLPWLQFQTCHLNMSMQHVPTAMVGLIRINLMLDWLQFNHFFWGI